MNRKGLALSVVLLASVGAASAIAATGGHFGGGHHGHGGWHKGHHGKGHGYHRGGKRHGKMGRYMRLKRLDADGDGSVTLDEFLKPRSDRFAALDTTADGALDASELTARMQQKSGQRQRIMMARLDADGDGQVTKEEFEKMAGHGRRGMRGGHHGHRGYGRHDGGGRGMHQRQGMEGMSGMAGMEGKGDEGGRGRGDRAERRAERREQRFSRMDANGDGVITAADLEARTAERLGWFQKKQLHVLDADGDGTVSRDEFTARSKQRFADIDLDKDGKITAADLPPGMAERWEKKREQGDK